MSDERPIGIFDSGIGGLTIAHAIENLLPNERFVFFGDTAHMPYGDKSSKSIKHYSERIVSFLKDQDCKVFVIACNTASAHSAKFLKNRFPELTIINVIDPIIDFCVDHQLLNIGIIGTKGTIKSRTYPRKLKEKYPQIKVNSLATPLLAPMIEEGFFNNNISRTIIGSYLSKKNLRKIEALILACTHYPLIKKEIEEFYKGSVKVIDSTEITAQQVKKILTHKNLLSNKKMGPHDFYVSDFTNSFQKTSQQFFGREVKLKPLNIWEE